MINPKCYSSCAEFYEVAQTVQFVKSYAGEDRRFKIEALFDPQNGNYSTKAYLQEDVTLQPSFPVTNGVFDRKPTTFTVWVSFTNIGWTSRATAEEAIEQALGFL